ncbi:MAG TPA: hypothetical protein ENN69_00265, partial [Spirochaetia bacterium]|nr:hypothetical protein [Spirochaetia bacterium]
MNNNTHGHFFKDQEPVRRINKYLLIVLGVAFFCSALILIFALQFEQIFPRYQAVDFKLHEPAPYDLISDRDILWVDEVKTEHRREEAARQAPTVFEINEEITRVALEKFTTYKNYLLSKKAGDVDPKKELLFHNLGLGSLLDKTTTDALLALAPEQLADLMSRTEMLLLEAMNNGIFSFEGVDQNLFDIKRVEVAREIAGSTISSERPLDEIITGKSLPTWVFNKTATMTLSTRERELTALLVAVFAEENCAYDPVATLQNRKNAEEAVQPVREILRAGFPIVGKGQVLTPELTSKVSAYRKNAVTATANKIISTLLFLAIIFATGVFLLGKTLSGKLYTKGEVFFLLLLVGIFLLAGVLLYRLLPLDGRYPLSLLLPTAASAVLVT